MTSEFTLIEAAGGRPKVAGTAYSGGKMSLPGWRNPVVVDLSGMEIPETVPLLTNHENRTDARIGMVRAKVEGSALLIEGEILSESEAAGGIVAQGKAGADWQLSIGADVRESELVKERANVNGMEQDGPFHCIRKSVLREVSVVAVGADSATRMRVSAQFNLNGETGTMTDDEKRALEAQAAQAAADEAKRKAEEEEAKRKEEEAAEAKRKAEEDAAKGKEGGKDEGGKADANAQPGIQAMADLAAANAVKAERERIAAVRRVCNGEFPEIEAEAIEGGWDANATAQKVLAAVRANRPSAGVNVVVHGAQEPGEQRKAITAAMCIRCGLDTESLEKDFGAKAIEAGMREMDMPLKQLLVECLRMEGRDPGRAFDNETIRAAFSTVSLPGILSDVANKRLLQSYRAQPVIATRLCTSGDLNDFKENDRFRLTDVGDLLPVAADGEIKEGGLAEEGAKNQIDTYGKKFCLTRKMVINDDLNAFMQVPAAMGNRAARLIDQLFFARLLKNPAQADGKALFSSAHRNLLTGANSALSAESLSKAIQLFLDQVDADGQPVSVEPSILLVPTALKHRAIELTKGATLVMAGGGETTVRPALNVLADEHLEVVSSPYLSNAGYEGASASGWYLFGKPGVVDTFEIGYLKGRRTPTVERGETDFNTLGVWFRVYFDVGVREQDHRGMVKANGQA